MSTNSLNEQTLDRLGEEFVNRMRRGEKPSIADFACRYSGEQAREAAEFLESIAMLEDLKQDGPENDPQVISIPKNFGRYQIERSLGEGGMGAVYLAHDSQLDRKVALKTPKFERNSDPNLISRFYREARSAATLQHPNICPVYDVGEIDGLHYISMAYIEGRPLSDVIRSKSLPPVTSVIRIVRKVALALHEAHVNGVVHRDLKPANIMIDRRNEPIVMDFGLARQFASDNNNDPIRAAGENLPAAASGKVEARLTMDGTVVGSPGYMSPEQLRGEHKRVGPTSDVYALGVLLYELLTRELPFPGDGSLMSVVNAVLSEPPPDASVIRPQLESEVVGIYRKAMAKNPEDRYQSMQSMAVALTKILRSESGGLDATASVADASAKGNSPALVRTQEQYELAKSLYQENQYAAAVSILEKMVSDSETRNQYTTWATRELPGARAKAEKASKTENTNSADDDAFWNVDSYPDDSPTNGRRPGIRSRKSRATKIPKWIYGLIGLGLACTVLLVSRSFVGTSATETSNDISSPQSQGDVAQPVETDTTVAAPAQPKDNSDRQSSAGFRPGRFSGDRISPAERLSRLDINQDGKISKQELNVPRVPQGGLLRRVLDDFDRFDFPPRDGALDQIEIQRLLRQFTRSGDNYGRPRRHSQ